MSDVRVLSTGTRGGRIALQSIVCNIFSVAECADFSVFAAVERVDVSRSKAMLSDNIFHLSSGNRYRVSSGISQHMEQPRSVGASTHAEISRIENLSSS
jgi:hypothetical protein